MATPFRIKRSAVPGKKPVVADLQLGELALNTYDGYLFSQRDTGGVGIGTTVSLLTPWIENYGGQSIYYNQSVGIGTTNATSKLTVVGDVYISGISTLGITSTTNLTSQSLVVSGISTFTNGPILVGTATTTGTASQRLQVNGGAYVSGNLGVGVTNPAANTQVAIAGTLGISEVGGAGTRTLLSSSAAGFVLNHNDNSNIDFRVLSTSKLQYQYSPNFWTIPAGVPFLVGTATSTGTASQPLQVTGGAYVSGSVGIGITNPASKMDVWSTTSSSTAIRATSSPSYSTSFYPGVISGLSTTGSGFPNFAASGIGVTSGELGVYSFFPTFANFPADRGPRRAVDLVGGFSTGIWGTEYFAINVGRDGTANDSAILTNERLRIDGSGNVGIGSINPTAKLDVSGIGQFTAGGATLNLVGTDHTYMQWYPDGIAAGRKAYTGYPNGSANYFTIANEIADGTGHINLDPGTNAAVLIDTTSATGTASQPLQVNGGAYVSGSVGIGTTNPSSKLHVIGDARVSGVITATTFVGALTGTATSTTNIPNLTGAITSVNTTTSLGSFTSAQLATALTDETGSGANVFATSPVLVTPSLGAASANSINSSGIVTATQFVTGASGSAIGINTNTISGPATITIDPAAVGDNTGLVVIKGDLQIDGTTTTINSTTVTVDDKNIILGSGAINDAAADGSGITIESGNGNKTFQFEDTGDNLGSSENLNVASGKVYKVNNTSVLSSTTLGSAVVNSSLTSVGSLGQLQVTGVSTFTNGPILVGTATSTGTASQPLQVNGGAYVSGVGVATGSIGVGITNPQGAIDIRTSPQWSSFNYGANLIIGGTRNNALGILDSSNSNPWAIVNSAGSLSFAQMPALGNTVSGPTEAARITSNRNLLIGSLTETGTASQRLQVNGGAYVSGSVGIGTTNPFRQLHIAQNSAAEIIIEQSNSRPDFRKWNFVADSGNSTTTGNFYLRLLNDAGNATTKTFWNINGSNNTQSFYDTVLIGTATSTGTASQPLQVNGGAYVSGNLGIGRTNPLEKIESSGPVLTFGVTGNNQTSAGSFDYYSNTNGLRLLSWGSAGNTGTISFWSGSGGSGATEKARFNSNGNLGIGTTTPTSKLDVIGDARVTGVVTATTFVGALTGNASTASSTPYWVNGTYGTNEIKAGTGDGASYTTYNVAFRSWHGIGFRDYTDNATVNAYLDCRTGSFSTKGQLISTVATGTAPLTVSSTTLVTNLNADLLDGISSGSFLRSDISQQGGKSYVTHDFNTYPSLYDVTFVNPTGSSNLPTGMTGVFSYRFIMGAGDTAARGFDLVGASEGSGNLYIRERYLGTWSRLWHNNNGGAGSGLDADLLDGKNTGTSGNTIPLLDGANTWSGSQLFTGTIGDSPTATSGVWVGKSSGGDGSIQLVGTSPHIDFANATEDYDVRIVRTGDNDLSIQGGNLFLENDLRLTGAGPTISLIDTDHATASIHVNSNIFYILRNVANTASWVQVDNIWPLEISLTNNDASFGRTITSQAYQNINHFYANWRNDGVTALASSYNLVMVGSNDTGNKLVMFVNSSTRTDDGGVNALTFRNDGGPLNLGSASYQTTILGSQINLSGGSTLYQRNNPAISNGSYGVPNNHIELRTDNASNPIIGFHRSGYTATALYHAGYGINSLRIKNADGNDGPIFSTFNGGAGSGLDADLLDGVDSASYSRLVHTTAVGGILAANGPNTWTKIATFSTGTTQFADCTLILSITNTLSPQHDSAIISVFFRSNATSENPTVDVEILSKGGTGSLIINDSFKVISGAWTTDMELWMKKGNYYGCFAVYETSKRVQGGTLTYNASPAWQSATPTGAVNNVSTDGVYEGLKITSASSITGTQLISTVATGTAPLTVSSTTLVTNLNADLLDGLNSATANTASTIVARDASGNFSAGTISATTVSTTSDINLSGELNFLTASNKCIDFYTDNDAGALSTAYLRLVNNASNSSHSAIEMVRGGAVRLFNNSFLRLETSYDGVIIVQNTGYWTGFAPQNNYVSASLEGGSYIDFRNESGVPKGSIHNIYFTNGGSELRFYTTASGIARGTDTRTLGMTISSNGTTTFPSTVTATTFSGALTGNASTATTATSATSATYLNASNYILRRGGSGNANTDFQNTPAGSMSHQGDDASATNGPGGTWWFYDNYRHSNGSSYWGTQVAWGWEDNANRLATRNIQNNTFGSWVYYLNSGNYNSYAPTLTGTGASGTWGISVSGNAATATTATTATQTLASLTGSNVADLISATIADNDFFRVRVGGTASNAGFVEIATADDGTEPIYVRQYTGLFSTIQRTLTLLDGSGNTTVPGILTGTEGRFTADNAILSTGTNITDDVWGGSIEIREINQVGNSIAGNPSSYAPGLTFHWGNVAASAIKMYSDGSIRFIAQYSTGSLYRPVYADQFISNVATGTAPLTVSSTTLVTNLNADLLDGLNSATANTASTIVARDASGNFSAGTITASLTGNSSTTSGCTFSNDAVNKADITTRTDSGFYEHDTATTAEGWPITSNTWMHMIACTHVNDANYYSMQIAASFFNNTDLYYRSTNGSGTTAWSKIWNSSGSVGIGVTNPETSLDIRIPAPSGTIGNVRILPSGNGQARYHLYNGGGEAEWIFGQKTASWHPFTISKSVAGSESDYFSITSVGNVGIGLTNPTDTLSVSGTINATSDISLGGELNFGGTPNNKIIDFYTRSSGGTNYSVNLRLVNHDSSIFHNGIVMYRGGAVELFYDNSIKLSTTSTGASVTGHLSGGTFEFLTATNVKSGLIRNSDTSQTATSLEFNSYRTADPVYAFLSCHSGNYGDLEFYIRGDGATFGDNSYLTPADYAEYFEWEDGNPDNEDRRGYTVTLIGSKIQKAINSDNILGVVSGNPAMVGDSAWGHWSQKYLKDEFNCPIYEEHNIIEWEETIIDENGKENTSLRSYEDWNIPEEVIVPEYAAIKTHDDKGNRFKHKKLNPNYDPLEQYVPRQDRKEWDAIGLLGKLRIRKGQPTRMNWIKMGDISDNVEEWLVR